MENISFEKECWNYKILNMYTKIYIWGCGEFYHKYKYLFSDRMYQIIDKNENKWGSCIDGKKVCPPQILVGERINETLIIICANAYEKIVNEVKQYGDFKIIDIGTLYNACGLYETYTDMRNIKKGVLVCAGVEALCGINGCVRFINEQRQILNSRDVVSVEIAPLRYKNSFDNYGEYFVYFINGKRKGIILFDRLIDCIEEWSFIAGFIIHGLYESFKILEPLCLRIKKIRNECSIIYYMHDHFLVCNNRFMYKDKKTCIDNEGKLLCNICENKKLQEELQRFHYNLFDEYSVTLIAPSEYMKNFISPFYPNIVCEKLPHLLYEYKDNVKKNEHEKIRVAFVGATAEIKGWNDFEKIVDALNDKYIFYCFSSMSDSVNNIKHVEIGLSSDAIGMTQALKKEEIDIAMCISTCPETYSYTYHEAVEAGCFIVTTDITGNVSLSVKKNETGKSFKNVEEIIKWLQDETRVKNVINNYSKTITFVKPNDGFLSLLNL